jgi:hypothetical protein
MYFNILSLNQTKHHVICARTEQIGANIKW